MLFFKATQNVKCLYILGNLSASVDEISASSEAIAAKNLVRMMDTVTNSISQIKISDKT